MSMKLFMILKFIQILCVYIGMTTVLPFFVLRTTLLRQRLTEKILICFLVGNFYIMNLVFLLQLLHISNQFTLIIGTFVPAFIAWVRINHIDLPEKICHTWHSMKKMAEGELGSKLVLTKMREGLSKRILWLVKYLGKAFAKRPLDWILVLGIFGAVLWYYGIGKLEVYGYNASDTPVHLWWINEMETNHIFVDGVYPFGYHCIIYYLHCIFGIDNYILMCLFSLVQTIAVHLVLLAFLRLCCKSRYIAYAMTLLYAIGNFLQPASYLRFFSVLPQEYGMLFILPSVYFAFRFFAARQRELKGKKTRLSSTWCLTLFAMSFGMTLAVHFYDTMIAGLFCVGIALGYLYWFVRKKYFWRVVLACFLGVFSAVLPMAVAFVSGTPLQGSLGWGMSVIQGEKWEDGTENQTNLSDNATVYYYDADGNLIDEETTDSKKALEETKKIKAPLSERIARVWMKLSTTIRDSVLNQPQSWYHIVVIAAFGVLFVFGILFFLLKKRLYGSMLLSMGWFMMFMWILQTAKELGIPELMDANRCRIYFAFMLPVVFAFALDAILRFILYPKKAWLLRDILSFACVVAVVVLLWGNGVTYRKQYVDNTPLVTNEALACLTNIINQEKDGTWTIVSANDETQMGLYHGYHYELISFLREMEYNHFEPGKELNIKIPTDSVYVFVEKVPLDYTETYTDSGQTISTRGAEMDLPNVGGINMYMGEYRWIVMSRIYYWAKEFQRLYPTNVSIYCETDQFVCYKIKQNPYRLFNFAIDYGYNTGKVRG